MAIFIRVNDSKGEGLDLVDYEDIRSTLEMFKADLPHKLSFLKSLEHKDNEVMICSYPKTGKQIEYFWMFQQLYYTRIRVCSKNVFMFK